MGHEGIRHDAVELEVCDQDSILLKSATESLQFSYYDPTAMDFSRGED